MGWWDEIKGMGTDLYNGVTTFPARAYVGERLGDIQRIGTNLYNNVTLYDAAVGAGLYSYKTIGGLFEQVATIPKFTYSVIFHANTRMVAGHVLRVALEDLLPLVAVTYTNDMIQRHYARDPRDDEQNQAYLGIDTAMTVGLGLLNIATWTYATRKKMQMTARTIVLTIEAGRNLNGVNNAPKMMLCKEQDCSTLRFVQGSIRDTAAYFATEAAISLIGWIPVAGEYMAAVLSIHHRGRYIATVVLPDLCNRHQVEYLKEHPELATALGSGHGILSKFAIDGIESLTNVPAIWYEAAVTQFMMFTSISMAAHLSLPKPVVESSRLSLDPVAAYQGGIGWLFDTMALGLKVQIPRMLKLPPSNMDWKMIGNVVGNVVVAVWQHPCARPIEFFLIPRMLRSKTAFTQDPVIEPNWAGLRETSIIAIGSIEKVKAHVLVKIGMINPKLSATALWYIFGLPQTVVELLLKLMGNETFMSEVSTLRRKLEAMDNLGVSDMGPSTQGFEVRDRRSLTLKALPEPVEASEPTKKLDPQTIIEPVAKAKSTSTESIVNSGVVKRVAKKMNPEDIINPRRDRFFGDPENIIRPRNNQTTNEQKAVESVETGGLHF